MEFYLKIVNDILTKGKIKSNRTGVDTLSLSGVIFEHDMSKGFPLLTTKKMYVKSVFGELEFLIKGLTDKKWLQDRGIHIWDDWCNPQKVPYGHDEETKMKMKEERDLGPLYGFQWRYFDADYLGYDADYTNKGRDQLKEAVEILKTNPYDRRMIVSAWNPKQINQMALPPCHYSFQLLANEDTNELDLLWNQRSIDTMLGLPFNIASYGLLLHLLAKESGFKEGRLVGFLADTHIYKNHFEGARKQLEREPLKLPIIETEKFNSIFNWEYTDTKLIDYNSYPKIKFDIAV